MRLRGLYLMFCVASIIIIGTNIVVSAASNGFRTYNNEQIGFSIDFPTEWNKEDGVGPPRGYNVIFSSPQEYPDDIFSENCNLIVAAKPKDMHLTDIVSVNLSNQIKYMDGFVLKKKGETTIDNNKSAWIFSSFRLQGNTLNSLAYYFDDGEKASIVTCVSEPDKYSKYKAIFENITHSFRWTEVAGKQ